MTNRTPRTNLSQSDIAIQIERLVQAIEQYDTPAFRFKRSRSGTEQIERTRLSRYFDSIQVMIHLFDDRYPYSYSEQLQAFWRACQEISLERGPSGPVCLNDSATGYLDHHDSMNKLRVKIRQMTREQWYRRKKDDRRYQARKLERRVTGYTDAVLGLYARTVVIRINLYYHQSVQVRLRVEQVFADLDRLIAERERSPIFEYETGYICAVEQGEDRGYHVHAAFFFNGAQVCRDIYKAQQIGELWERITRDQGYYDSCNHDKEKYGDELGVGNVLRNDLEIRTHVHYVMRYLVKDDQHLRLKPQGARCLRMGCR